ncbi:MAG: alanine racemase [Oscillospiraceae bacterium]
MDYLKRTWAEIHLDRLKLNMEGFRAALGRDAAGNTAQIMCVVKADCYGHCDRAIAPFLQDTLGVDWFAVSNLEEAVHMRDSGITGEILILGYTPPEAAGEIERYDIIQTVTELPYARELARYIAPGKRVRVHIKIDTGMTRIGLHAQGVSGEAAVNAVCDEAQEIVRTPGICAEGIFTHLAVADSDAPDDAAYTENQRAMILAVAAQLKKRLVLLEQVHYLNSAGGLYLNDSQSTLARLGIVLYGLCPNPALAVPFPLHPVMELRSRVAQVKTVKAGTCVSYGRTFTAPRDMEIATVCAGYADGYPRALSNRGAVLVGGKRAPIVGRVCMDQFMCDVTGLGVKSGDVATLIGTDGCETVTADDIAALCGTIGYEIVCGISKRVPRVIFRDGAAYNVYK